VDYTLVWRGRAGAGIHQTRGDRSAGIEHDAGRPVGIGGQGMAARAERCVGLVVLHYIRRCAPAHRSRPCPPLSPPISRGRRRITASDRRRFGRPRLLTTRNPGCIMPSDGQERAGPPPCFTRNPRSPGAQRTPSLRFHAGCGTPAARIAQSVTPAPESERGRAVYSPDHDAPSAMRVHHARRL
jgi:hypothetical protein